MNKKIISTIKMLFILCMLLPMMGIAQTKNVVSTHRVFPKVDKAMEFEKALAVHAQKYHTGDVHWRVFAIQSGPDFGGYHITEGPKSWESEDTRGDINPEHQMDWNKSVAVYLTDRQSGGYSVYQDSLSTVAIGDYSDKMQITHLYPKMGLSDNVWNMIRRVRKTWMANGVMAAVYSLNGSGPSQYALVTRYKQGLKEKADGVRKPFREVYNAVNGDGAYAQFNKDLIEFVDESWSELLFYRKDLSSK